MRLPLQIMLCLLLLPSLQSSVAAEDSTAEPAAKPAAAVETETPAATPPVKGLMVDDIVELPFEPLEAYGLFTNSEGDVQIAPARFLPLQTSLKSKTERLRYFLRAELETSDQAIDAFSFLVLGADRKQGTFTPLFRISARNEQLYQRSTDDIGRGIEAVEKELEDSRAQLRAISDELRLLRDRASQIAGINDIVDLKVELANLQGRGQAMQTEVERLEALKMLGRHLPDPADSKEMQQNLLRDLRETASVTATADRLNDRRRQAAAETVQQKLALIQETQIYDPEQLGREVLRLRNIRRDLQARINGSKSPTSRDF